MPTTTRVAIAAAVIAIFNNNAVLAQTSADASSKATPSDVRPDQRASAVIRAIDQESAPTGAVPVDVTELARARAAGEWQTTARGAPTQVERIQIDDMGRAGARAVGRGAAGGTKSASDKSAAARRGVQSKAEIAWSAPAEQRDYRTAIERTDSTQ